MSEKTDHETAVLLLRLVADMVYHPEMDIWVDVDYFNKVAKNVNLPFRLVKEEDGN